jgi:hypothetical protein
MLMRALASVWERMMSAYCIQRGTPKSSKSIVTSVVCTMELFFYKDARGPYA